MNLGESLFSKELFSQRKLYSVETAGQAMVVTDGRERIGTWLSSCALERVVTMESFKEHNQIFSIDCIWAEVHLRFFLIGKKKKHSCRWLISDPFFFSLCLECLSWFVFWLLFHLGGFITWCSWIAVIVYGLPFFYLFFIYLCQIQE